MLSSTMDHFTTLPPELLLAIISHLPSTSSLLPLIQTCTYLRGFIHIHAASICNNFILTTPLYTQAALILSSSFSSTGWLLPTHHCIIAAETRIIRDKILFSGCSCNSCKHILHTSVSGSEVSLEQEGLGRMLCFPTTTGKKVCRAGFDERMLRLSEPGPQFVMFLEKYGWEVVARWGMSVGSSEEKVDRDIYYEEVEILSTIHEEDEEQEVSLGQDSRMEAESRRLEEKRNKEEEVFSFMVGNYCVRRFLEDVEKNFSRINDPEDDDHLATPKKVITEKIKSSFGILKSCLGRRKEKKPKPAASMMFGEIPSDENMPALAEKQKRPVERWMKGLVWYYGVSTTTPLPEAVGQGLGKTKLGGCVGNVRSGFNKARMKVRQVWRRLGRGNMQMQREGMGEFESLDD